MNSSEAEKCFLKSLLQQWKLSHCFNYFLAEDIDVEILQIIKVQHIYELLKNFTLGDRIRFEYELEKWRISIGKPLKVDSIGPIITSPIVMTPETTTKTIPDQFQNSREIETQTDFLTDNLIQIETDNNRMKILPLSIASPLPPTSISTEIIDSPRLLRTPTPPASGEIRPRGRPPMKQLQKGLSGKLNARSILMQCKPRGPELMKLYETKWSFRPVQRTELINLFARYFYENSIHLPVKMCYELERQILKLFPGERLKDYRTEKRGKIYIRLSNIKNNTRRSKEFKAKLNESSNTTMSTDLIPEEIYVNSIKDNEMDDNSISTDSPTMTIFLPDIKQENSEREDD